MKTKLAASLLALSVVACNTTVTEQIDPVTGKVISRTTVTSVDGPAVNAAATTAAIIYQPKGRPVRAEK